MTQPSDAAAPHNPLVPVELHDDDEIQFHCHRGIACFNQCCQHIDITLAPYDIVRLKNRLGMGSREFLAKHAVPFEMDGAGMPGIKLRQREGSLACPFVTEEGCSIYEDRPTACRYYALGQMSLRKMGAAQDEVKYFMIQEPHCLGHNEPRHITIRDYRHEQQVEDYDAVNRGWRQIILKKRSSGPTVGRPSQRSYQLFFLASYDMDGFREFLQSDSFRKLFVLDGAEYQQVLDDEVERLRFAARFLRQVLFGENTIPLRQDVAEARLEQRSAEIKARIAGQRAQDGDMRNEIALDD
jgi:hypothetical protein